MKLAVIPARGGSKRIPHKNIKAFSGRPIISWSIKAAYESGCFDKIIVSTDDDEIADIARLYGAEVPFKRPADLSTDYASTIPVIAHAVEWARSVSKVEYVCCIYATAPLVSADNLRKGIDLLIESNAPYSFSVTNYGYPIQRALRIGLSGRIEMVSPEKFDARSQDLETMYHDAGQFYWGKADAWLQGVPIFSSGSIPIFLPEYMAQDIDTLEDWRNAEIKFDLVNAIKRAQHVDLL